MNRTDLRGRIPAFLGIPAAVILLAATVVPAPALAVTATALEVDCPWVRVVVADENGQSSNGLWGTGHFLCEGTTFAGIFEAFTSVRVQNGSPWPLDATIELFVDGRPLDSVNFQVPAHDARRRGLGAYLTATGAVSGMYTLKVVPHLATDIPHLEPAGSLSITVLQHHCTIDAQQQGDGSVVPIFNCADFLVPESPSVWSPGNVRR